MVTHRLIAFKKSILNRSFKNRLNRFFPNTSHFIKDRFYQNATNHVLNNRLTMEVFNWFCKLSSTHWEFLAVKWLFFCYFHFMLLFVGLKYRLLTPLKNYSTKKPVKKLTTSYSYISRVTGYI